jgi:excisionase family DNA binding protein
MRNEALHRGVTNMHTITSELMTRKDVCQLFKVSLPTVLRLEAAGKLTPVRLGAGSVRHRKSDVEKFITESITV